MHAYIHTYVRRYVHTCIHAYMHTFMHAYTHAFIHTYVGRTYIHTCIHAYMHTCMHTYLHTYVRTCIHTCIHMCILPSPNFAGIDRQTWTMKCIDMCFLATVGSCVVGLLANSGVHTWEICCCQLCARHPWLSFPHSPSKFCQALRLAFHAPLISIGLSIGWVAISFFKNICTWRSKQPRAFPLYFFHDAVCPIAVHQKVRRGLSFGRWQRYCILARRSLAAFNSSSRYLFGHLQWVLHGDWILWAWLISEPGVLVRDFLSFFVVLAVRQTSSGGQTFHGIMVIRPETTKGEFNVVFAFRIMQDKFASWATFQPLAGKTDGIPAFVPVCPFTLCSLVAARWEASVIPLLCLMYCCFPDWIPNLKFAACKTEGFAKSFKLCATQRNGFWIDRTFRSCVRLMRSSTQFGSQRYHYIPLHYSYITLHYIATKYNAIQYKTIQYNTLHYITYIHCQIHAYIYIYIYVCVCA